MDQILQYSRVFYTGLFLGLIITLILMYFYHSSSSETFINPNDLDPESKALLAYHNMTDPISSAKLVKSMSKQRQMGQNSGMERAENKNEVPALVSMLYR